MDRDKILIRAKVRRDLWALVKAKATREAKTIPDVLNEILEEHFKNEKGS
ncbi:MAG: hypothetical protein JRD89_18885 [Deltaproteobacteria bacterium]|nr:hypothetical protein [Deltaproteobacteria bacterium]